MQKGSSASGPRHGASASSSFWPWVLGVGCVLVLIAGLLLPRPGNGPTGAPDQRLSAPIQGSTSGDGQGARPPSSRRQPGPEPLLSAEEAVGGKVRQFANSRRAMTHAMADKFKVQVPPEAEQLFTAVEAGRWDEVKAAFEALKGGRSTNSAVNRLWGPIMETFGVAEVAHNWPSQQLLDYGQAVLGSLRPGMVYSGGTDAGRFIPTLLNETGGSEQHVVLTQNALADNSYREYLDFRYHDHLATLSEEDSQRAFSDYLADAQKRLAHDQQNPDEPRQVRPGEDIRNTDGRVTVAGQVAVMAVNERLFQTLMDKNPNLSFALEESFPFKSMNSAAVPLGPVLELRAPTAADTYTTERADQAVDYWRDATQQLLADSQLAADSDVRKEYAKMAGAQASLLAEHHSNEQAAQAYQLANELCPSSPEVVFRYVNYLLGQNRAQDALQVVQTAVGAAPDNQIFRSLLDNLKNYRR